MGATDLRKKYTDLRANANVNAFLLTIRKGEGTLNPKGQYSGYHILYGGGTFDSLAAFPQWPGKWATVNGTPRQTHAAGAYQFQPGSWQDVAASVSLTDYSEQSQDLGALYNIDKWCKALDDVIAGKIVTAMKKCSGQWASLPFSTAGQPKSDLDKAIAFYKSQGGTVDPGDTGDISNLNAEKDNQLIAEIIRLAKSQVGVVEAPVNTGAQVNAYQFAANAPAGSFWCMSFVYWVYATACKNVNHKNPLIQTAGVMYQWDNTNQYHVQNPYPGAVVIFNYKDGPHCGIVISADKDYIYTIEGNTSSGDKEVRNGGGVYNKTHRRRDNVSIKGYIYPFGGNQIAVDDAGQQDQLEKMLAINLEAIQNNVDNLEKDSVEFGWGARQSVLEQSDWIGLRQFLIYLSMTYMPHGVIPFVELIPKFFLDGAASATNFKDDQGFEFSFTAKEKERFLRMKQRMDEFNKQGGIDMLTLDPFGDLQAFKTGASTDGNATQQDNVNTRNLGYKIYGALVLNPAVTGNETSKAGMIGFKSLDISQGSSTQQGMTLVDIKLVDVQGNKFFDISSPWSFLLNPSQTGGDFFLRYGWQIAIPDNDSDPYSAGYKFWNHPGWKVFRSADEKPDDTTHLTKLQTDILSFSKYNSRFNGPANSEMVPYGCLTITQSNNLMSMIEPGWVYQREKDANGNYTAATFVVDRPLDLKHYVTISIVDRKVSVESKDGSVTADLQFRTSEALANCLVPLAKASVMNSFVKDLPDATTTLDQLMMKFVEDNYAYVGSNEQLQNRKDLAIKPNDPAQPLDSWLQVIRLSNGGRLSSSEISGIKIKISERLSGILNQNQDSKDTNLNLRGWITEVLSENDVTFLAAGDGLLGDAGNPTGGFVLAWDDHNGGNQDDSQNNQATDAALQYFGVSRTERLVFQDDVFAFRFRGSLVEDISIETSDATSLQANKAREATAGETTSNETTSQQGDNGNKADANTNPQMTDLQGVVRWADKKRNLHVLLANMGVATVKCLCHPWIRVGFAVWIKGTGYFDGKYIVSQHKINFEDNRLTSELTCVRALEDQDYTNKAQQIQNDRETASQNGTPPNVASPLYYANNAAFQDNYKKWQENNTTFKWYPKPRKGFDFGTGYGSNNSGGGFTP